MNGAEGNHSTQTTAPALVEAERIGRRANDGSPLLNSVSLRVAAGERWGVTGTVGSGKTLFLRALAVLDEVSQGQILWNGRPIANHEVPEFRRHVIYLHQRPVLIEGSVEDNLRLPEMLGRAPRRLFDRSRAIDLLKVVDREHIFLERRSEQLSGGESQIVAVIRAVLLAPDVLLLDEPTASLDRASAQGIESLVNRWLQEAPKQRALVWVSHDASQIERMADKRIRLRAGEVVKGP